MSEPLFPLRRGASHDTIWKSWSDDEAKRLTSLPPGELLLAVQTGATADLVEADRNQVLASLAAKGHPQAAKAQLISSRSPRRPAPFGGMGLPCRAKPVRWTLRTRIWIAIVLTVAVWAATIGVGFVALPSPPPVFVP